MRTIKETSVGRLLYFSAKENIALVGKVIAAGIVSRMMEILSFLLPVKAFLISAKKEVPGYFPDIFHQYDYRFVILVLAVLAIIFYIISYVLDKYTEGKAGKLAISSLGSTLKADDVSNKFVSRIAGKVFSSYVECFFILTVMLLMAILSPFLLISLIPYYLFVALVIRRKLNKRDMKDLRDNNGETDEEGEFQFSIYVDIGFVIGFFTALIISFQANKIEMIYLFVCFILMRRVKGSINKLIKDYVFLKTKLV